MSAAMPQQVDHYDVLGELGRGGMGVVYRVQDRRSGQQAALKIVAPETLGFRETALRFKREFRAMQRVRHPNVIRVFEAGVHAGSPYFTMELIEGQELGRWLDGPTPIVQTRGDAPPAGALSEEQRERLNAPRRIERLGEALIQIGFALSAIHGHRIVHRDLKPDNIHVSRAGVVKLMDFGIAKQMSSASMNSGGVVVGTFKYLSPEQAQSLPLDGRSDLYSLGVVLYELLAGRHPFYSESSVGYAYHHARSVPPPISRFNPEVPGGLRDICERLLAKDPNDRFPTAEEFVTAVREAVQGLAAPMEGLGQFPPTGPLTRPGLTASFAAPHVPLRSTLFAPGFVGREVESQSLLELCLATQQSRGELALVSGPAGAGRSRLLQEAAARASPVGVDFRIVQPRRDELGAYAAYVGALEKLVGDISKGDKVEARRLLDREGSVLARRIPAFEQELGVAPAAPLDPEPERLRFFGAVRALIERVAERRPLVLALDDLHYADELSRELTKHLAQSLRTQGPLPESGAHPLRRWSLVVSLPSDLPEARESLESYAAPPARRVSLAPLDPDAVREMLQTMIGGGEVADAVGIALHTMTEGLPARVEERIRSWADTGELQRRGAEWVLVRPDARSTRPPAAPESESGADDWASLPAEALVKLASATAGDVPLPTREEPESRRHLPQLSEAARDVVERLAVFGERIDAGLLPRVTLRPEDELLDAIDELIKADVLVESRDASEMAFSHASLRSAALARIEPDKVRQLHSLAARVLETDARVRRHPSDPDVLCRHLLAAGEPILALEQLILAGRRALDASANQSAATRAREAQDLLARESAKHAFSVTLAKLEGRLLLLRLDVLAALGEHREAVHLATRRLPRLRGFADSPLAGEVLLRLATSERVLGNLDEALRHVADALQTTEQGGAHELRCRAKNLCGVICAQRGHHDQAERYFSDTLELARQIGDARSEELARAALAARRLVVGDYEGAGAAFEKLRMSAELRAERLGVAKYASALGLMAQIRGAHDVAEQSFSLCIDLAKASGDRRTLAHGLSSLAALRLDELRFEDALTLTEKAKRLARELGDVEYQARLACLEAHIYLESGHLELAHERVESACEAAQRAQSALDTAEARILRGLLRCIGGDVVRAAPDIDVGLCTARSQKAQRVLLWGLYAEAHLARALRDAERARRARQEGLDIASGSGDARFIHRFTTLVA